MSNVTSLNEVKTQKILGDFQKQKLNFDLNKLKNALNEVFTSSEILSYSATTESLVHGIVPSCISFLMFCVR